MPPAPTKEEKEAAAALKKQIEAALRIQKLFRGSLARNRNSEDLMSRGLQYFLAIVKGVEAKDDKPAIKARRPLTTGERAVVAKRAADDSKDRAGKEYTAEQRAAYGKILETSEKLKNDAATTIQAVFRGYQARKALKKSKEKEGEAKTPSTPEERAKAAILIQAQVRGHQAIYVVDGFRIKRFNAMLNDSKKNTPKFERLTEDDIKRLDERMRSLGMVAVKGWAEENMMKPGQEMKKDKDKAFGLYEGYRKIKEEIDRIDRDAASKIQKWWKRSKAISKKKKEGGGGPLTAPNSVVIKTPEDLKAAIRDYIAKQKDVVIDSRQLKKEMSDPALGYKPSGQHQKQWIEGIHGHGVYTLDSRGNPIGHLDSKGNPIITMDKNVYPMTLRWDSHLGLERARGLWHENIELSPAGIPIAVYSSLLELQRDIDKVKKKHEIWNFPGKVNPMGFNEVKTSLVRYNDPQATRPCYIMLTETREGITQHFVNGTTIEEKKAAVELQYKGVKYVADVTEAYQNLSLITDDATKIETAHLIVRQGLRDKMMKDIIDEVHQDQKQHKALRPLDEEDLKRLSGDEDFRASIGQAFLSYKVPPATFKRGAVSISKAYRAADIVWDLAAEHTDFKINIPDTNFYIGVHIATEAREHTCWVNGALRKVYREKGEVWIDDNTCHYSVDGKNYEPLCTHTDYLQRNTGAKRLVDHVAAKTQFGGITGRAQEFIDAFAIKVRSPYGVAVKVGRNVVGSILDPIAHVDKNGKQVKIVKALPTVDEINTASVAGDRWQGADDKFVQCSVHLRQDKKTSIVTNFSKPILALQGEVPYFGRDMSTQERENNKIADIVEEKLEQKLSGIFIKIKHIPNKKDVKGERHIEGEYYRDVVPYKYDGAAYVEITPSVLYNELRAVKLAMDKEATSNNTKVTISEEDIKEYSKRFFERVAQKVRVRNLLSENEFEKNEEELRYNARNGHLKSYEDAAGNSVDGVTEIIKKYTDRDEAIKAKFTVDDQTQVLIDEHAHLEAELAAANLATDDMILGAWRAKTAMQKALAKNATSEEIAEFRSKMVFDLNATDPETGRTALHLAAMSGRKDIVEALIAARVDPNIKDKKGQTAAQLARNASHFNPKDTNSWVVKLESDAEKFKIEKSCDEVESLKRDSDILQGRAYNLRDNLDKLKLEVSGLTQKALDAFPSAGAAATTADDESAKLNLRQWLRKLDDARAESIKAENLAIAALEKSEGKAPKDPKIETAKVVPDAATYRVVNCPVTIGDKTFKMPRYYAIQSGVVPVYVDGEQQNIMMNAGEVMFARNTVLLINKDGIEFVKAVRTTPSYSWQKNASITDHPDGWKQGQWDKVSRFNKLFEEEDAKKDNNRKAEGISLFNDKKIEVAKIKFDEPADFKRTPSPATVKHPIGMELSEIKERKDYVTKLEKERAEAKKVAKTVGGGGAAHT